jgi:hypothetical protein
MRPYKLMNYSSAVPMEKSILDIERLLSRAGASKIAKDYSGDGAVTGFFFSIPTNSGEMIFRMPCDVEKVYTVLLAEKKKMHYDTKKRVREQANRVAWRILLDWTSAQLTMIRLQQVKPQQAFLPYAWDPERRQTLFERFEEGGFKQLGSGTIIDG